MKKISIIIMLIMCIASICVVAEAAKNMGYQFPIADESKKITKYYSDGHSGIDIGGVKVGTPIYATKAGTVVNRFTGCTNYSRQYGTCESAKKCSPVIDKDYSSDAYCNWGFGLGFIIRHNDGTWAEYAHMSSVADLKVGSTVEQGTYLGGVGSSGNSSGPHLHFGIRTGNVSSFWNATPLNPLSYMDLDDTGTSSAPETPSTPEEPEVHTHSYTVFMYYGINHPHYAYYKCSQCDETSAKNEFGYISTCDECVNNHTHTPDTYLYQGTSHPHYKYYKCRCGETIANGTNDSYTFKYYGENHPHYAYYGCVHCDYTMAKEEFGFLNSCNICLYTPTKPLLKSINSYYETCDDIIFNWDATENTTHYNLYLYKMDSNGEYQYYEYIFYAESGCSRSFEPGKYRVLLESKNSNYWNIEGTDWLSSYGDAIYFQVKGISSTVTKKENTLTIHIELYNLTAPYEMIIAGYKNNRFITSIHIPIETSKEFISETLNHSDIDTIKVMVWNDTETFVPLCEAEEITNDRFTME